MPLPLLGIVIYLYIPSVCVDMETAQAIHIAPRKIRFHGSVKPHLANEKKGPWTLLLVAIPGAPSSILAPSSQARSP